MTRQLTAADFRDAQALANWMEEFIRSVKPIGVAALLVPYSVGTQITARLSEHAVSTEAMVSAFVCLEDKGITFESKTSDQLLPNHQKLNLPPESYSNSSGFPACRVDDFQSKSSAVGPQLKAISQYQSIRDTEHTARVLANEYEFAFATGQNHRLIQIWQDIHNLINSFSDPAQTAERNLNRIKQLFPPRGALRMQVNQMTVVDYQQLQQNYSSGQLQSIKDKSQRRGRQAAQQAFQYRNRRQRSGK